MSRVPKRAPIGTAASALALLDARERRESAFLWVALNDDPGRRLLGCQRDGHELDLSGTLGSAEADDRAAELGVRALGGDPDVHEGVHRLRDDPPTDAYLEVHRPDPELLIVGAGHIARPLTEVGALLGLRVVVLVTRFEALRQLLSAGVEVAYIA